TDPFTPARKSAGMERGTTGYRAGNTVRLKPDLRGRSLCLFDLGFLGPLLDHVNRVFAVSLLLVALPGRGDVLAVRSQEPPAVLPSVILVGLELQLGCGILLDPLDGVLAVALVLVALAGRGDDLAIGRLEPPAMLITPILVDLERERSGRGAGRVLRPL